MTQDNKLLPCPFCGGEAKRFTLQDQDNFGGDVITCQRCNACSCVVFGEKEGLVDAWNSRVIQGAIDLLNEINDYLDDHKENTIHSGSKIHMKIKDYLYKE